MSKHEWREVARWLMVLAGLLVLVSVVGRGQEVARAGLPDAPMPGGRAVATITVVGSQPPVAISPARARQLAWSRSWRVRGLSAADLSLRLLDAYTSHNLFTHPCGCYHEIDPIAPGGGGWGKQLGYQLGVAAAVQVGGRLLARRGGRSARLATWLLAGDVGMEAGTVGRNFWIMSQPAVYHREGQPVAIQTRPPMPSAPARTGNLQK